MSSFVKIVSNNERSSVLKIFLVLEFKHYHTSVCVIEEKWDYKEYKHVYCKAVNPKELNQYEAFTFSNLKNNEEFQDSKEIGEINTN